jgi:hypothetical protein
LLEIVCRTSGYPESAMAITDFSPASESPLLSTNASTEQGPAQFEVKVSSDSTPVNSQIGFIPSPEAPVQLIPPVQLLPLPTPQQFKPPVPQPVMGKLDPQAPVTTPANSPVLKPAAAPVQADQVKPIVSRNQPQSNPVRSQSAPESQASRAGANGGLSSQSTRPTANVPAELERLAKTIILLLQSTDAAKSNGPVKSGKLGSKSGFEPTRRLGGDEASRFTSDAKALGRILRQDRLAPFSRSPFDNRRPDPLLMASVNVRGGPFFAGVGARKPEVGLNWAVTGVDLVGLGRGAANVLQGKGVGQDVRIPVQAYVEGNIDQLPTIVGQAIRAMTNNAPKQAESDFGVLLRATLKGDKNGNLEVDSVIAVPILDLAKKDGVLGAGLNKGASTGAVVFEWSRDKNGNFNLLPSASATSFDVAAKKLADKKNQESAEVALPVGGPGITGFLFGWTQTNRPGLGAADGALPGILQVAVDNAAKKELGETGRKILPRGSDEFGKLVVAAGAVDAVGKDIVRSLNGTVAKNSDGQFFSRTLTGLGRFIISPSTPGVGIYLEPRASAEFVQDGKRDINVFAANEKKPLFSVKEQDLNNFGNRVIDLLNKIPGVPAPSPDNAIPR